MTNENSIGDLADEDYTALADFRHALRQFLAFSEQAATGCGLTRSSIRRCWRSRAGDRAVTVGYVAERLILKPHSATGLIDRLEALGLVERHAAPGDRRRALLVLTDKAREQLARLTATHREEILRLRPLLTDVLHQMGL
jgi:DNA-binding MarR family transcriptional regulator